jgi:hypothetical protein
VCFDVTDLRYLAAVPASAIVASPKIVRAATSDFADELAVEFDVPTNAVLNQPVWCAESGLFGCGTMAYLDASLPVRRVPPAAAVL